MDLGLFIKRILTSQREAFKEFSDFRLELKRMQDFANSKGNELHEKQKKLNDVRAKLLERCDEESFQELVQFECEIEGQKSAVNHLVAYVGHRIIGLRNSEKARHILVVVLERAGGFLAGELKKLDAEDAARHKRLGLDGEPASSDAANSLRSTIDQIVALRNEIDKEPRPGSWQRAESLLQNLNIE